MQRLCRGSLRLLSRNLVVSGSTAWPKTVLHYIPVIGLWFSSLGIFSTTHPLCHTSSLLLPHPSSHSSCPWLGLRHLILLSSALPFLLALSASLLVIVFHTIPFRWFRSRKRETRCLTSLFRRPDNLTLPHHYHQFITQDLITRPA